MFAIVVCGNVAVGSWDEVRRAAITLRKRGVHGVLRRATAEEIKFHEENNDQDWYELDYYLTLHEMY